MVGLFHLLPLEYDSNMDVAHSVVMHLFGSMLMIHSSSIRKRLPQILATLDIFLKTKTVKICIDTVSRPRHVSRLPIPDDERP